MNELSKRYDRNIRLFGEEGQRKLRQTKVLIVGAGGLGCVLAQNAALLGPAEIASLDHDELEETSRNRAVSARHDDPVPGSPKVTLVTRMIREINPDVRAVAIEKNLVSPEGFAAVKEADWVFGCLDEDGPRFILNELCATYGKPYIDLASDVPEPGAYGGRICVSYEGDGCLSCLGLLDQNDVRRYLATAEEREREDAAYGIPRSALGEAGPSVAPINAVVAGLAATEFMVAVTGLRAPRRLIEYRGHLSKVLVISDAPKSDCYYCKGIRSKPEDADVERYLHRLQQRTAT